jgi:hypothetical protein
MMRRAVHHRAHAEWLVQESYEMENSESNPLEKLLLLFPRDVYS